VIDETIDMIIARTSKTRMRLFGTALAIASLLSLASCGGSDDGMAPVVAPVASNTPPASASQSVDGFIAFLKTVVPTMPETTSPLDVSAFVAPVSDTGLPDPSI